VLGVLMTFGASWTSKSCQNLPQIKKSQSVVELKGKMNPDFASLMKDEPKNKQTPLIMEIYY
jgi:hypothetical protein